MHYVGSLLKCRANCSLSSEHDALRDKSQERVLCVAHMFLAMIYPPTLHEWVAIVAWDAAFTFYVAKDGYQ